MMELTEAICKQKKGQAPASDSIPDKYNKYFEDTLSEKLRDLITKIFDGGQILDTWRQSTTTFRFKMAVLR